MKNVSWTVCSYGCLKMFKKGSGNKASFYPEIICRKQHKILKHDRSDLVFKALLFTEKMTAKNSRGGRTWREGFPLQGTEAATLPEPEPLTPVGLVVKLQVRVLSKNKLHS